MIRVAKKGMPNWSFYILSFFFSSILIINSFWTEEGYIMIIIGLLLLIGPIVDFIKFHKCPEDIIKYNEKNNTLLIKEKYLVNISRIRKIAYSKYCQGIIIKTNYETYRCLSVQNPIECYHKLMELRYPK